MKRLRSLILTALLGFAGGSKIMAADTCKGDCSAQATGRQKWSFCVDAQTGAFDGKRFYSRRDVVLVKVCNMNPFAAVVTVSVAETVVTESVLSDLQSVLAGAPAATNANNKAQAAAQTDAAAAKALKIGPESQTPEELLAAQSKILERINNNLQALRAGNLPFADAQKVAGDIVVDIDKLAAASDLSAAAAQHRQSAIQPGANATAAEVSHDVAHNTSVEVTATALDAAATQINKVRVLEPALIAFRDQKDNCQVVATILPDYHSARTATLTANKTPVNADGTLGTQAALGKPVDLTLGSGLFAASVGIAISPLAKVSYQSIGSPSSAGSSSSSSNIIALQENSNTRTQVMTLVSANLLDGLWGREWCCSVHLSAGFTLSSNKISTNPEFLFGPSLSFLRDQFFLTAGVYGGFQESLTGGYTVGGAAPSGSIPTVNQFHWKPGFAISWRVPKLTSSN
jgi:hypothetical protein